MNIVSKPEAYMKEALIVIGGALLAALILSRFPKVKAFINENTSVF